MGFVQEFRKRISDPILKFVSVTPQHFDEAIHSLFVLGGD